jgi:hypothetical protein
MVATTARARQPARPRVLLRTVPMLDPPYEDETDPVRWTVGTDGPRFDDGQLTLRLSPAPEAVRPGHARPVTASGPAGALTTPRAVAPPLRGPAPVALPAAALATATPEAERAARRFLGCCLEVLNGYRPAAQLRPLLAPADAAAVIEHLVAATGLVPSRPRGRAGLPPTGWTDPVRLRTHRVCEPAAGVAETAAALGVADRTWAMAFRLERRRGTWLGITAQVWTHRLRGATQPGTGRTG